MTTEIEELKASLVEALETLVEAQVEARGKAKLREFIDRFNAASAPPKNGHIKPPAKPPVTARVAPGKPAKRKHTLQLCPAPRCKNAAAPVFGMVCATHKGTPKKTVAAWREIRRERKAEGR